MKSVQGVKLEKYKSCNDLPPSFALSSNMLNFVVERKVFSGGRTKSHGKSIASDYSLLSGPTVSSGVGIAVIQCHLGSVDRNASISAPSICKIIVDQ